MTNKITTTTATIITTTTTTFLGCDSIEMNLVFVICQYHVMEYRCGRLRLHCHGGTGRGSGQIGQLTVREGVEKKKMLVKFEPATSKTYKFPPWQTNRSQKSVIACKIYLYCNLICPIVNYIIRVGG